MLQKVSQVAEQLATCVSRRAFLRRIGRAAITVATATAALLWAPAQAQAAQRFKCCVYLLPDGNTFNHCVRGNCPKEAGGYPLVDRFFVSNCLDCTGPLL